MSDLQEGPLTPLSSQGTPVAARPQKLTRREERRRRRIRRRRGEEILGWILVPIICYGIYWGISAGFDVLGTTPGTVWDQLMQVKQMLEKKA
ncbi:hypothetical protein [Methylobacterium sp. E-045]|uniref:hypothetical protein n=1 Tax=Methylobacterium sp. E-045 TaxID=2836575 RepID=UPI001FB9D7CC|nr:hypothetical protein [Methylobacterium sp. E-045]MCJ2129164.1 hypothetical protein [Methylobacterium sp. E-045]